MLVSCIIACYNSELTIKKTVLSVIAQEDISVEILIYDDASTDSTIEILRDLEAVYPQVLVYSAKENRGAGFARDYLLKRISGDYIAFLDSDDYWYPSKLKSQIAYMHEKKCKVCVCSYHVVNEQDEIIGRRDVPRQITGFKMHLTNWIPMSMALLDASLNSATSMSHLRKRQDYAYWLTLFTKNRGLKACGLKYCLGSYKRRRNSVSASTLDNIIYTYRVLRIYAKLNVIHAGFCILCISIIRVLRH